MPRGTHSSSTVSLCARGAAAAGSGARHRSMGARKGATARCSVRAASAARTSSSTPQRHGTLARRIAALVTAAAPQAPARGQRRSGGSRAADKCHVTTNRARHTSRVRGHRGPHLQCPKRVTAGRGGTAAALRAHRHSHAYLQLRSALGSGSRIKQRARPWSSHLHCAHRCSLRRSLFSQPFFLPSRRWMEESWRGREGPPSDGRACKEATSVPVREHSRAHLARSQRWKGC